DKVNKLAHTVADALASLEQVDFIEDRNTIRVEVRRILEELLKEEEKLDQAACCLVQLFLFFQQLFQDAPHFHADGVAVLNKIHLLQRGQCVSHRVGQLVELIAREPHSTALYLRTSSFLTFLNISW